MTVTEIVMLRWHLPRHLQRCCLQMSSQGVPHEGDKLQSDL